MGEEEHLKEWAKTKKNIYISNSNGGGVHRDIWIKHFGVIPKGFVIHHKDGNPKNNKIENLECLSHKEHGERHKGVRVVVHNLITT